MKNHLAIIGYGSLSRIVVDAVAQKLKEKWEITGIYTRSPQKCEAEFAPDKANTTDASASAKNAAKAPLSSASEIIGVVVFFGTAIALMLQSSVLKFLQIWQICLTGAVLMIIFKVLRPKEAVQAIPLSMLFLIVGALAMAGALAGTGVGDLIGGIISQVVSALNNNYLVGLIFFLVPFILTQFLI